MRGRALALLVAGAVLLSACGGGAKKDLPQATKKAADLVGDQDAQKTTTTEAPRAPAPLSGLPVDPDAAIRSAVSVKVDNSPDGRPQAGLEKADLVYEEKVEGGVTRFIAIFQSRDSELVGPIRSLRTTDPSVVSAFGGVFAFSDGVAVSLKRLKGAPVVAVTEHDDSAAFINPKGKHRPYATFATTARLRKEDKAPHAPQPAFSYLAEGEAFAPAGATPASTVKINFGGMTTGGFQWDAASGTWLRSTNGSPHLLADGTRLAFTNVILEKVAYKKVGYNDSSGHPVDEAGVVGSGDAIVLVAGKQVKAKWSKSSASAMTVYTDSAGVPIKLLPGPTMVSFPPTTAPISIT